MVDSCIGSVHLYHSTLTSTNRFAQELLSKTRPRAGTVISAAFQTAGEGQFGRSWFASKGKNLSLSMILYPQLAASSQFGLSAMTALAIHDTVSHFVEQEVHIKWPNDIYASGSKIAGILIQNTLSGKMLQHSVIGIGLNVNEMEFPEGISAPTSIRILSGDKSDLRDVRTVLFNALNSRYKELTSLPLEHLVTSYKKHLFRLGEVANFELLEQQTALKARIEGVDQYGRLLLTYNGKTTAYSNSEIKYIS